MKRSYFALFVTLLLFVILTSMTLVSSACAPEKPQVSPADFYKQEVVTLVCPYAAGGGADLDARLFAARWGEITGGTMVNVNKIAAGGIEGANNVYTAKPDGLTLGHGGPSSSMYVPTLMNDPALKVDIAKVNWFGSFKQTQFLLAVGNHVSAKSIEDLQKIKGLRFGAFSPTAAFAQAAAVVADIFKLDMKLVTGYSNVSEIAVAIGKKEVDAFVPETQAYLIESKKGFLQPPYFILDFDRTEWYPDVKKVGEITKLSPQQENLLKILTLTSGQGKAFYGPPGLPADKVKFLRDAWNKTMENKAFVKQMQELRYPVWEKPLTGEEVAKRAVDVVELKKSYGDLAELVKKYTK